MTDSGQQKLVVALAGVAVLSFVALAWKSTHSSNVNRAANQVASEQTLPPLAAAEAPAPPMAAPQPDVELTSEERRQKRYDKDMDGSVSRDEFLASRRKAFAKLDVNGNGELSFDEYAVKTIEKFGKADADRSGVLSAAEFSSTAAKRHAPKIADCPPDAKREE